MCFNQTGDISTLNGGPLELVDKFTYLGSSVSSTETDINTQLAKAWIAIDCLSVIWKSDLSDKIKRSFFPKQWSYQYCYGCTTCTLTKQMEKKLDGNYTRIQRAVLNLSCRQHPTKQQQFSWSVVPHFTKTIPVRRTRHAGHCLRSKNELIRNVIQWTSSHGQAKAGRPARIYLSHLCANTGCSLEDLPGAMDDRDRWRERVREIRASSITWWSWLVPFFFLHLIGPL